MFEILSERNKLYHFLNRIRVILNNIGFKFFVFVTIKNNSKIKF